MPITYTVDRAHRRLRARGEGLVTYADLAAHVEAVVADGAVGYGRLVDLRDARTEVRAVEMCLLAEQVAAALAGAERLGPVAFVATDEALYDMLRLFEVLTAHLRPVLVFRDVRTADEWLREADDRRPAG